MRDTSVLFSETTNNRPHCCAWTLTWVAALNFLWVAWPWSLFIQSTTIWDSNKVVQFILTSAMIGSFGVAKPHQF